MDALACVEVPMISNQLAVHQTKYDSTVHCMYATTHTTRDFCNCVHRPCWEYKYVCRIFHEPETVYTTHHRINKRDTSLAGVGTRLIENGKEREERNILLQRTEKNARTFRSFEKRRGECYVIFSRFLYKTGNNLYQ